MAQWVTFPENKDVVAFGRKNGMLVVLVSKFGIYKKELGKDTINCLGKAMKISHFNHILIELCYFSLHQ